MAMVYTVDVDHAALVLSTLVRGAESRHFDDVRISAAPTRHVANPGFPVRSAGGVGAYVSIETRAQQAVRGHVLHPSPDHVRPSPAAGYMGFCANSCVDGGRTAGSAYPKTCV